MFRRIRHAAVLIPLALACARARATGAATALAGTYAVDLPDGRWTLTFLPGSRDSVTRNGEFAVLGRYRVAGDTIVFSANDTGPRACAPSAGTATYLWRASNGTLTFTAVADQCRGREGFFSTKPFTRADTGNR